MQPEENKIPESTFNTFFVKHNNDFHTYGFKEWIFYPGMLFQDKETWWTDNGFRPTPHEGIDLCFHRDSSGEVRRIGNGTKIPVIYEGDIIAELAALSENSKMFPHIHIIMAWIPESRPCYQFN